jgi:alpha-methylacyl-CoA racemase
VQIVPPAHAYSAHRGLQRVLLDLKSPAGVDVFLRMAATAQVVIESFRPGVMHRLGLGYDAVRAHNPTIVYCSTTGYGQTGPHAQWAGHDLNYLAVSGFLAGCGRQVGGRPPIPGATIADSAGGGMHAVIAILAALVSGDGAWLDVSVAEGMLSLMALQVDEYLALGTEPDNILTGRYACYGVYPTADDGWLSVAAIEPRFWANLCAALGLDEWIEHQLDDAVQDRIRADLERCFRTRSRDDWVQALAPADTCVAPVLSVTEVVEDEQFVARNACVVNGGLRQVGAVLAGMAPVAPVGDPQRTDTDAVLTAAGVPADEIERLRDKGVVA